MTDLNDTAGKIHKMKYAKDGEDWQHTCFRVASHISMGDDKLLETFFNMIYNLAFLPGGRILANAGTEIKNLNNCFVLPVGDSRQSIYGTLRDSAEAFAHGAGVGYNFSHIREEGAPIKSTGGKASGPLSFMGLFDHTGEVIQQASRRGAQMGFLNIDHPDIEQFINFKGNLNSRNARLLEEYKRNLERVGLDKRGVKYFDILSKTLADDQLTHFNISVMLTDKFVTSFLSDRIWELKSVVDGSVVKEIKADDLLRKVAEQAWKSGDPGVAFYDRINEDNMVKYIGMLECSNPCGEQFLLPYESCCLGSINLHACFDSEKKTVDWEFLEYLVRNAVQFLDNVQTLSEVPMEDVNRMSKGLRRLGLGVMGWADLLAELEIPYSSDDALDLATRIGWFITYFAYLESMSLALDKGTFEFYDMEKVDLHHVMKVLNDSHYSPNRLSEEEVRKIGFRNVAVTSIAPTGTIALIAGVNSSIEPYFALAYKRHITEGVGNTAKETIIEINPILFKKLKETLSDEQLEKVKEQILKTGTLKGIPEISEKLKAVFITAGEIVPKDHIRMQAAWQEYVDNSISKTINMPEESTVEDIMGAFLEGWNYNLKGMTVYRNNSKLFQILNKGV